MSIPGLFQAPSELCKLKKKLYQISWENWKSHFLMSYKALGCHKTIRHLKYHLWKPDVISAAEFNLRPAEARESCPRPLLGSKFLPTLRIHVSVIMAIHGEFKNGIPWGWGHVCIIIFSEGYNEIGWISNGKWLKNT